MHLTVFVWGFTAILGRLISLNAVALVWYRLAIVVLVMAALIAHRKLGFAVARSQRIPLMVAGICVGLHWMLFYGTIKYAGVAVAVLCLSTIAFFTALIQPLVFKTLPTAIEIAIGLCVTLGVALIVQLETTIDALGLALGFGSAVFSAVFGTLNGKIARDVRGEILTLHELSVAFVVTCIYFFIRPSEFVSPLSISLKDGVLLLALAIGCTVLPWMWSLRVLQTLKPYTLALAVSLEPVYAMLMAYFVFADGEAFGWRFYVGSAILVALVVLNSFLKSKPQRSLCPV